MTTAITDRFMTPSAMALPEFSFRPVFEHPPTGDFRPSMKRAPEALPWLLLAALFLTPEAALRGQVGFEGLGVLDPSSARAAGRAAVPHIRLVFGLTALADRTNPESPRRRTSRGRHQ